MSLSSQSWVFAVYVTQEKKRVFADVCSLADDRKELSVLVIQLGVQRILTVPSGTVERTISGIW